MSTVELKKRLVKTLSSDPAAVKSGEMKEAVATSGGKLERSYTTIGVSSDQSLLSKVTSQIVSCRGVVQLGGLVLGCPGRSH